MSSSMASPQSGELPVTRPTSPSSQSSPSLFGFPLKYVSLVTLALQNAVLGIVLHYSMVFIPAEKKYSPAVAVLVIELLKGSISFCIAFCRIDGSRLADYRPVGVHTGGDGVALWPLRFRKLCREIFSNDCWKLSIPAILYVIQNNLQFVAATNLDVATFQVTYQMKILTTAAFSVVLLGKRLTSMKWLALLGLAIGVGIVQIQATANKPGTTAVHGALTMNPLKGFLAVSAACFTSGLAGVYFEMVLKRSQADLWVRNVQLSLFSLVPALFPIIFDQTPTPTTSFFDWLSGLFTNFGIWAWSIVAIQVFGGLITAVVIKYSDNILKGFATSLSIILSFIASVVLFDYAITLGFIIGCSIVLAATWLYNQPDSKPPAVFLGSPIDTPMAANTSAHSKRMSITSVPSRLASAIGLSSAEPSPLTEKDLPLSAVDTRYPPLRSSGTGTPTGLYSRSESLTDVSLSGHGR